MPPKSQTLLGAFNSKVASVLFYDSGNICVKQWESYCLTILCVVAFSPLMIVTK